MKSNATAKPYIILVNSLILVIITCSCTPLQPPVVPNWQLPDWAKTARSSSPTISVKQPATNSNFINPPQTNTIPNSQQQPNNIANLSNIWHKKVSLQTNRLPLDKIIQGLSQIYRFSYQIRVSTNSQISYSAHQTPLGNIIHDLTQLAKVNYKITSNHLKIVEDTPFWKNYRLPLLNVKRSVKIQSTLAQQIRSGQSPQATGLQIDNTSVYDPWGQFIKLAQEIATNNQSKILTYPEMGLISLYGNTQSHQQITQLLQDLHHENTQQVYIEMAIMEVELSKQYASGIDWSLFNNSKEFSITASNLASSIGQAPRTVIQATGIMDGISLNLGARLISKFGTTKVLSSPQLRILNNQTAALKVVDNLVYFTVDSNTLQSANNLTVNYKTIANTIAVGLIVSITPKVLKDDMILLNIKPTLSRVQGYINDPNPALAQKNIVSKIPILRERQLETLLKVRSNDVAIIGGLLQQKLVNTANETPGLSGYLSFSNNEKINSELVIFLRAHIDN